MRISTRITWNLAGEITEHEFYEYDGVVDLCCGATKDEKDIALESKNASAEAHKQASTVFGHDDQVFNTMFDKFNSIFSGGPNQMGFSQNELNAMQARAKQMSTVNARNAMTGIKGAQSAFGGGNTSMPSGARIAEQMGVANASAANEADVMNKIDMANWETGRDNFWKAGEGMGKLPSVFSNMPGMTNAATDANKQAMSNAQTVASANNWWVAPVEGLVGAGLQAATGGLAGWAGSAMKGVSGFASGAAAATHDAQGAAEDAAAGGGGAWDGSTWN